MRPVVCVPVTPHSRTGVSLQHRNHSRRHTLRSARGVRLSNMPLLKVGVVVTSRCRRRAS